MTRRMKSKPVAGGTFCGVAERFGDGSAITRLATNRPTWHVAESIRLNLPRPAVRRACETAFSRWSEVCDVVFTEADDPRHANFVIVSHDFHGAGGVLADCELPHPSLARQKIRIDSNESWDFFNLPEPPKAGLTDLIRVLCHEMGHGLGLLHFPPQPPSELMEPSYSDVIIAPQPAEIKLVQSLYGLPLTPAQPKPDGKAILVDVTVTIGGVRYQARERQNRWGNEHNNAGASRQVEQRERTKSSQ